jgi:hypothetical protein
MIGQTISQYKILEQLGEAGTALEELRSDHYNTQRFSDFGPILCYHLGTAYEESWIS